MPKWIFQKTSTDQQGDNKDCANEKGKEDLFIYCKNSKHNYHGVTFEIMVKYPRLDIRQFKHFKILIHLEYMENVKIAKFWHFINCKILMQDFMIFKMNISDLDMGTVADFRGQILL